MQIAPRPLKQLALFAVACMLSACTGPAAVIGLIGVATDTSASWSIVKHIHDKWVEGGPVPCYRFDNTVERALAIQCQPYAAGTIKAADVAAPNRLPMCPLAVAARDTRLWHVLPELIEKGAMPESCERAPLAELAQVDACPDFAAASPKVRESMMWLAQADARSVHHDVVRMLSCPKAREVGFDGAIARWIEQGQMPAARMSFSPLSALHPNMLSSPLAARLEADGHRARTGLDPYQGTLRSGFEEAFRSGNFEALDWWFARAPELANRVPPPQGNQLPWVPLAKTLSDDWLDNPNQKQKMVEYLLARGANPADQVAAPARHDGAASGAPDEEPDGAAARERARAIASARGGRSRAGRAVGVGPHACRFAAALPPRRCGPARDGPSPDRRSQLCCDAPSVTACLRVLPSRDSVSVTLSLGLKRSS